jgi:transposase
MAKACPLYLREKVIAYMKERKSKMKIAKVFRLNRKMIDRWGKRQKEGKSTMATRKVERSQKLESEALREYTKRHPDKILKRVGQRF